MATARPATAPPARSPAVAEALVPGETVKVAVRARPLLPAERAGRAKEAVRVGSKGVVVAGADRGFVFDSSFGTASTQEEVYDTCVAPLVESCFGGARPARPLQYVAPANAAAVRWSLARALDAAES
jgi:hypothetical protein